MIKRYQYFQKQTWWIAVADFSLATFLWQWCVGVAWWKWGSQGEDKRRGKCCNLL